MEETKTTKTNQSNETIQFKLMRDLTPDEIKKEFHLVPCVMRRVKSRSGNYYTCSVEIVPGLINKQIPSDQFSEAHYNNIGLSIHKKNPSIDPMTSNEIKFNAYARFSIGTNVAKGEEFYLIEVVLNNAVKRTMFLDYLEVDNYNTAKEMNPSLPDFVKKPVTEKDIGDALI